MEEERGLDSLRHEASGGVDGPLLGGSVCAPVERNPQSIISTAGGFSRSLGSSVHRANGDTGHQGGTHAGRDLGLGESSRDRASSGHPVPADSCNTGCEDEGWQLGEGRGHRADQHSEIPGKHRDAGPDKCLIRRFRQAWRLHDSDKSASAGFGRFFSVAAASLMSALGRKHSPCPLGFQIFRMRRLLHEFSLKDVCSRGGGRLGHSPAHVFPLPPFSKNGAVVTKPGNSAPAVCPGLVDGANVVMAALNMMHGGPIDTGLRTVLTAAHRRVHAQIACALEAMVLTDEPILSSEGLDGFLKQSEHYSGSGVVLPLGERGGVPDKAADVELWRHLRGAFPEMAEQVVHPRALLLPSRRRPRCVKRGYTWLASSYPQLVKRNVRAGLHRLKKSREVAKHRGVKCLAGAFAVKKDAHEDRVITDPSVNQLLDPEKLPRPRFAYIPKLRCLHVPSNGVVVVSKRDARHYFHRLRIGRRWQKWLCGPSVMRGTGCEAVLMASSILCSADGVWAISRVGTRAYGCRGRGCEFVCRAAIASRPCGT